MTDRDAIAARARMLRAVADDDRSPEGERANARALAYRLIAKYQLEPDELTPPEPSWLDGLFDGMFNGIGVEVGIWKDRVAPHLDRIDEALDAIARELDDTPTTKMNLALTLRVWRHMKDKLDGRWTWQGESLTKRRNRLVKERYQELYAQFLAEEERAEPDDHDKAFAHDRAVDYVAMGTGLEDLSKRQIEAIVGVRSDVLHQRAYESHEHMKKTERAE